MATSLHAAAFAHAREKPPRLVLLFAVLTAVSVAAAGAVIVVVVRHYDVAQAERAAIDRARFAAEAVLRPSLHAEDLAHRVTGTRKRALDRLFARRVLMQGLERATLYGASGAVVYTTGRGPTAGRSEEQLHEALAGTAVSDLATATDGSRVLGTYVPLALGSGRVGGVVRLEQDYGPIAASAQRFAWLVAGVLEALLLVLLLAFVPVLARAASRIRAHVRELEYHVLHDELTGLPNRQAFRGEAMRMVAAQGDGVLAILDIDGFTEVEETLGERGGDGILLSVAERLSFELDDVVALARLGDDEFGVLLDESGVGRVDDLAARAGRALSLPIVVGGVRVAATVSVGAAFIEPGADFETLMRRAATALSLAKRPGQSSLQICGSEVDLRDVSCLAMVAELRDALENGELLVHYQPQSDLTTRRIRGVEALLRWEHPEDGLLPADRFIGYIERSGLSKDVRELVLERSVAQWRAWRDLGIDIELAINLSPVDMLDVSLPEDIERLLARYGLPARRLVLEITERLLLADVRRARAVVESLTCIGVRIAVDDFGTGYSSLASLRSFPIRQVKLDRSLLTDVPGDPGAESIVGGCVEIAHGIGATVVAEGVETPDQWRFASLMGCDIAQGYLVGRPGPADELTPLLAAPNHVPLTVVA